MHIEQFDDKVPSELRKKLIQIKDEFYQTYNGKDLKYIIIAPGRVNLIGDHIDYHGFSVLPMALAKQIYMAIGFEQKRLPDDIPSSIRLSNTSANHEYWTSKHSLQLGSDMIGSHKWYNYFLCGYHGLLSKIKKINNSLDECLLAEMYILIDSDLPQASGLSSSSALVCGSAIATRLLLNECPTINSSDIGGDIIDEINLAHDCATFERLIGTQGGGMDQAVIMTAKLGYAKYVKFQPNLSCSDVSLPEGLVFVISHSGVEHHKAATNYFNCRVLETKIGASLIASFHDYKNESILWPTLSELKRKIFPNMDINQLISHIRNDVFKSKLDWTIDEISHSLGLSEAELCEKFQINQDLIETCNNGKFRLSPRCEHVFEEAERVERFRLLCDKSSHLNDDECKQLGQLMTTSHWSLKSKFECSHESLDRLVGIALEAGALGSRLTGAGWGGSVVTMVESSKKDQVMARLTQYSKFTFISEPSFGCRIFRL